MINTKNTNLFSIRIKSNPSFNSIKSLNEFLKKEKRTEIPNVPAELKGVINFKNKKTPIMSMENSELVKDKKLSLISLLMSKRRE